MFDHNQQSTQQQLSYTLPFKVTFGNDVKLKDVAARGSAGRGVKAGF
jgi:hypothetical protein